MPVLGSRDIYGFVSLNIWISDKVCMFLNACAPRLVWFFDAHIRLATQFTCKYVHKISCWEVVFNPLIPQYSHFISVIRYALTSKNCQIAKKINLFIAVYPEIDLWSPNINKYKCYHVSNMKMPCYDVSKQN